MNAAPSLWVRTRAGISRTATSLRLGASNITNSFSVVFYVLMGLSVALLLLCGLVVLLGESEIFLRAPLGFKNESLTGIPALAELLAWPLAGGALAFWFVARFFGSLSDRWRCTSYFYPGISDQALRHAPRCSLMPGHSGQHFCEVSGHKYYWQPCARCGELVSGSDLCEKCRLPLAQENVLKRAVEDAIRETGANSLSQMGLVMTVAWSRLGGRFDETELQKAVRARLLGK